MSVANKNKLHIIYMSHKIAGQQQYSIIMLYESQQFNQWWVTLFLGNSSCGQHVLMHMVQN